MAGHRGPILGKLLAPSAGCTGAMVMAAKMASGHGLQLIFTRVAKVSPHRMFSWWTFGACQILEKAMMAAAILAMVLSAVGTGPSEAAPQHGRHNGRLGGHDERAR